MKKKALKIVRYERHVDMNTKKAANVPIYRLVEVEIPDKKDIK